MYVRTYKESATVFQCFSLTNSIDKVMAVKNNVEIVREKQYELLQCMYI